jgi:hypothetical protein
MPRLIEGGIKAGILDARIGVSFVKDAADPGTQSTRGCGAETG